MRGSEKNNIKYCRVLRKSQTDAENKLWLFIRNRQCENLKFRRQHPVGKYILDFYCPRYKLGIEVDGGQHYDDVGKKKDAVRTLELEKQNIKILRFSNLDVLLNIEGVYEVIQEAVGKKTLTSILSLEGRGGKDL